jgi:hypothetical protein
VGFEIQAKSGKQVSEGKRQRLRSGAARCAESIGADGVQVLAPRGSDEGIVEHYGLKPSGQFI